MVTANACWRHGASLVCLAIAGTWWLIPIIFNTKHSHIETTNTDNGMQEKYSKLAVNNHPTSNSFPWCYLGVWGSKKIQRKAVDHWAQIILNNLTYNHHSNFGPKKAQLISRWDNLTKGQQFNSMMTMTSLLHQKPTWINTDLKNDSGNA